MTTEQVTRYIAEDGKTFDNQVDCANYEYQLRYWKEYEEKGCPKAILSKLVHELTECLDVPEGIVVTCSHDAIRMKRMIHVCQKFAENYKSWLAHY